ncbi:hypothetical protein RchiOBHm_Chr5g0048691 [Rosa chinensis]|uniref:Uncharacterized protein n=1 Tax=Rosa chinensis TaxID=74649 RepID=A0A2P6QEN4_ROSCH|nr:hypothetical protein RchiOBHm_Chr5g0048691 [Rosa chinensis]
MSNIALCSLFLPFFFLISFIFIFFFSPYLLPRSYHTQSERLNQNHRTPTQMAFAPT